MNPIVRKAKDSDWTAIREICCLTGKSGNPIESNRFEIFSEIWIGPYQKLLPEWTFVLENEDQIIGYITGCPNTLQFNRKKLLRHTIPMFFNICVDQLYKNSDIKRLLKQTIRLQNTPENSFSEETKGKLLKEFPAHLHINLLKEARGKGWGDLLIKALIEELKTKQINGIHLYCGNGPVSFYQKNNFKILEQIKFNQTAEVYCMVRHFS